MINGNLFSYAPQNSVFSYATGANLGDGKPGGSFHVADVDTDVVSGLKLLVAEGQTTLSSGESIGFSFTNELGETVTVSDATIQGSGRLAEAGEHSGVLTAQGTDANGDEIALMLVMNGNHGKPVEYLKAGQWGLHDNDQDINALIYDSDVVIPADALLPLANDGGAAAAPEDPAAGDDAIDGVTILPTLLRFDASDLNLDGQTDNNPGDGSSADDWAFDGFFAAREGAELAAEGINGRDAVDFSGHDGILVHTTHSLGQNRSDYSGSERTISVTFETPSHDDMMGGPQTIFEMNGAAKGYNLKFLPDPENNGVPTLFAYGFGTGMPPIRISDVGPNEVHTIVMVHDASAGGRPFSVYHNGEHIQTLTGLAEIPYDSVSLGGVYGWDRDPFNAVDSFGGFGQPIENYDSEAFSSAEQKQSFGGKIGEFQLSNVAATEEQVQAMFELADAKWQAGSDEELIGTDGEDVLRGGYGDDRIVGAGGDDSLFGGQGNDKVYGGSGNDSLVGNQGDDVLHGNDGDDLLSGDQGVDVLMGGAGNDRLWGGDGNDRWLDGGDGDDEVHGEAGDDKIFGNAGSDTLSGGEGEDVVLGGDGNDTINGDAGADRVMGGAGNDTVRGGDGDDAWIAGDAGDDTLYGDAGDDKMGGGTGSDTMYGGDGADKMMGGAGGDVIRGEAGNDKIFAGDGSDSVFGGDGDDHIDGNADGDTLYGGGGNDFVIGGSGNDNVRGDDGNDHLFGREDNDTIIGGSGTDKMFGESGHDAMDGGHGDDFLSGGSGDDQMFGGYGADKMLGGAGSDTLTSGAGNDHLWGGGFRGDESSDRFVFERGTGADTIHDFESGVDLIDLGSLNASGWDEVIAAFDTDNGNLVIDLSQLGGDEGDKVTIMGHNPDTVSADDFLF